MTVHPLRERRADMLEDLQAAVPHELRDCRAWLLFRLHEKPGGEKFDKVPHYANGRRRSGQQGSEDDLAQLADFGEAMRLLQAGPDYDGLGFAVLPCHPVTALDLDNIEETPERRSFADAVLATGTYCEVSPSGRGWRAFFAGKPGLGNRKNHAVGVEVFESAGFVTVTGCELSDGADLLPMPDDLRAQLDALLTPAKQGQPAGDAPGFTAFDLARLAPTLRARIEAGYEAGADRSAALYRLVFTLRRAGLNAAQAYGLLGRHDLAWLAPALDRRGGDLEAARAWLWKYCIAPAYAQPIERPELDGEGDPWPVPVNILADFAAAPYEPGDVPPVLGDFAALYAEASGLDVSITLTAALAAAAAALSDDFSIVGDRRTGWLESARLWVLGIGPPGRGKTPAQRAALRPLWDLQREVTAAHELELAALAEDADRPPRPRIVVGDCTIEALSEALRDNPRGLLLAADEFESWLGSMDAYRQRGASRDRGEWLRLFDGGPHTVERVQRGSVFVPNYGASILTATTPAALAKLSRHLPEDGLMQRFLPAISGPRQAPRDAGPRLEPARTAWAAAVRQVHSLAPRAHGGAVVLSEPAAACFREYLEVNAATVEAVYPAQPALAGHLAKHPTLALRVMLTCHALEAAGRNADPAGETVTLGELERAQRFMQSVTRHALALFVRLTGESGAYGLARDVARLILARSMGAVERRDLLQRVRAFQRAEEREQAEALRLLVDLGWLRVAEGGYTKAMPTRYAVNPRLFEQFADLAARERELREARLRLLRDQVAVGQED